MTRNDINALNIFFHANSNDWKLQNVCESLTTLINNVDDGKLREQLKRVAKSLSKSSEQLDKINRTWINKIPLHANKKEK